jgi:uncharacterized protein YecT (DUF1311 family)
MRQLKILGLLILLGQSFIVLGQTQAELTDDSNKRLKKVEAELTSVYNKILTSYSDDKEFIKNLKESQELWTKFRTTELKVMYPDREPGYYGSVHQMCINDYLAELTNDRIKRLRIWLTGTVEGDVCSGSIKVKD